MCRLADKSSAVMVRPEYCGFVTFVSFAMWLCLESLHVVSEKRHVHKADSVGWFEYCCGLWSFGGAGLGNVSARSCSFGCLSGAGCGEASWGEVKFQTGGEVTSSPAVLGGRLCGEHQEMCFILGARTEIFMR